jgi:hypothetical protein
MAKLFPCKTEGCGGSYKADVPESPNDWAPEDWGRFMEAQSEHVRTHPDSLRTQGGPDPRPKRDWVGCRCKGTCRCPRRRARR